MPKGAATRDRIIDHAFRVATVEGIGGVTLGRLAADVGMSKSGLFAHFRSKEELQLEVLRVAAERFTETVVKPALAAPRGLPRVRAVFERWMTWTADEDCMPGGCLFAAAGVELDDQPGVLRDALADAQAAGDVLGANRVLMDAFATDVRELCAKVRSELGASADPIADLRESGYLDRVAEERAEGQGAAWI
jgi:AcrR family transcriptional regulator